MSIRSEVCEVLDQKRPTGLTSEVVEHLVDVVGIEANRSTLSRYVREWKAGDLGETHSTDDEPEAPDDGGAPEQSHGLDLLERPYHYNQGDDVYVVWVDHRPEALVIPGEKARAMKRSYSNWTGDQSTINDICKQYGVNRTDFVAIKRAFGWTHDSAPLTDEEIVDRPIDAQVQDLARERERELERQWQKKKWRDTEKAAKKWREWNREVARPLVDAVRDATPPSVPGPSSPPENVAAALYPADGHLDQLNVDGTGIDENIDVWLRCHADLVDRIGRIVTPEVTYLALGSDMWNVDTDAGATTSGTPQHNADRPEATIDQVAEAGCQAVDIARQLGPVRVLVVPGNHDRRTCHLYRWALEGRYSDVDDVEVIGRAEHRQYVVYGENLLMFAHGDGVGGGKTRKAQTLTSIMASERAVDWGATSHKFAHLGHLHHSWEDDDGVRVQQVPTTAKADEWHDRRGYVTSQRGQHGWIYDRAGGQLARVESSP